MLDNLIIERLEKFDIEDAKGIGKLMPFLNERFTDDPMSSDILNAIINSPYHIQIVARLNGQIVGAATLSLILGPVTKKKAYLSDFVTNPDIRGKGVGSKIWDEMIAWCKEKDANLTFTSNPTREQAHKFYLDRGAKIYETTVFKVSV